jgi:hypothetical protein
MACVDFIDRAVRVATAALRSMTSLLNAFALVREQPTTAASAMTAVLPGTGHNEADWPARPDGVLLFLMGTR